MPSIEELITLKLCEDHHRLWTAAFAAAASRVLARGMLTSFDPASGRFPGRFPPVNDLSWRVQVLKLSTDLAAICDGNLLGNFDVLNQAIANGVDNCGRQYDKRTKPRMLRHISRVRAELMSTPVSNGIIATVGAIDIWRAAADELARQAHEHLLNDPRFPDSTLHNYLLTAGYFWVCNLEDENLVRNQLDDFAGSMLSVQGPSLTSSSTCPRKGWGTSG